jgi:hypothetical protein
MKVAIIVLLTYGNEQCFRKRVIADILFVTRIAKLRLPVRTPDRLLTLFAPLENIARQIRKPPRWLGAAQAKGKRRLNGLCLGPFVPEGKRLAM